MIRVDPNTAFLAANESIAAKRKRRGKKASRNSGTSSASLSQPTSFQKLLGEVLPTHQPQTRDLNELWQDLPTVEKELLDHPSLANLERYKSLVFEIARRVLQTNIEAVQLESRFRKGEKKSLTLHRFIDHRLKKMAEAIMDPRVPAFALLKSTMEIRGLLLDYIK